MSILIFRALKLQFATIGSYFRYTEHAPFNRSRPCTLHLMDTVLWYSSPKCICLTIVLFRFSNGLSRFTLRNSFFLVVDCGDPGHPRNGLTTASGGFTYGNEVTFSCNDNYVLDGSLLATCQNNGKWSKRLPVCLGKKYHSLILLMLINDNSEFEYTTTK